MCDVLVACLGERVCAWCGVCMIQLVYIAFGVPLAARVFAVGGGVVYHYLRALLHIVNRCTLALSRMILRPKPVAPDELPVTPCATQQSLSSSQCTSAVHTSS